MLHAQSLTPLMKQYHDIKEEYQDALLFFQMGDFYELFYEDAKRAASFLGIALTARGKDKGKPIPLCGVPVHTRDHYVAKLIKGGFNVAICDQLEPATPGTIVQRGVTQVLTPGTLIDDTLLDEKKASYLFSCFPTSDNCGLLFGELLTAQLFATTVPLQAYKTLESELSRFFPDEILVPSTSFGKQYATRFKQWGYHTTIVQDIQPQETQNTDEWIMRQFDQNVTRTLVHHLSLKYALHSLYRYVKRNQKTAVDQFHTMTFYKPDEFLMLDTATQRNLELVKNSHDGSVKHTLFEILDRAKTPMGSRLLRKWIVRPLLHKTGIMQRQDTIKLFMSNKAQHERIAHLLASIGDIERIVGRIALDRAPLHDYLSLKKAITILPTLIDLLAWYADCSHLQTIAQSCQEFESLAILLDNALHDDMTKPWIIKQGFDHELDRIRDLVMHSTEKLAELERIEQKKTGISSLKVRYNQVHGYYIEVTKGNLDMIPDYYIRRQTLVGKERFITGDLQKLEYDIEHARSEINERERTIFTTVKIKIHTYVGPLRKLAYALSNLDALLSLTTVARQQNYVRPTFNEARDILITEGRHPVVESVLAERFIANDTTLTDSQSALIITGPNMGGKSTYLRQVALISIMAQMGSFVPANRASLPFLDRIFTRIGAGDNVAQGKSTFLIEMEETATICTHATARSLVILDEVGRGTSTFDGLAIAQAVIEHIFMRIGARCLFATHYHELTKLQAEHPGIMSYYAASTKTAHGVVFLYKMVPGVADGSFGIEVGKLACLPDSVIQRAQEVLATLNGKP